MKKFSVLMVCSANICRSPMAQGLLLHHAERAGLGKAIRVDSAGTHVFRRGHRPDARAQRAAEAAGIDIRRLKARQFEPRDYGRHDYILAMDERNLDYLASECPGEHAHKLALMMAFAPAAGEREVPDPYYGNYAGFERVFALLDEAVTGFLEHLRAQKT